MTQQAGRGSMAAAGGGAPPPGTAQAGAGPSAVRIAELVRDHHAELYRYAFRLSGSPADAEDLVQQTFLVAQQKLHQLREAERARQWLFSVLRSCFLKSRRKATPATASALDLDVNVIAADPGQSVHVDAEQLQAALNQLPDEARLVLTMFYFEHASYKEIAEQLDVKIGTVMSRLSRAKDRLRRLLFSTAGAPEKNALPRSGGRPTSSRRS
jgi:RNA polymerase sigma-70 factor (ECF subfamily)